LRRCAPLRPRRKFYPASSKTTIPIPSGIPHGCSSGGRENSTPLGALPSRTRSPGSGDHYHLGARVTRLPCYLRRRSGAPPVGTKRSASRESCHTDRNARAASPRRGRSHSTVCLAGTSAALLRLRVVSCLCSSIDRSRANLRKVGGGVLAAFRKERQKDAALACVWSVATRCCRIWPTRATRCALRDSSFP
jgi:hypothetical protein